MCRVERSPLEPGSNANKIYFFKAGSIDAPYLARMSQSGGTVTANGIQFGGDSGTYDSASSAVLQLSGGSLYVGAQGITRGSAAAGLAVEIQLQGGTLGASQNWSSSLDMQLGAVLGGVTLRAQDAASTARNITLTGNLSDDSEVIGSLTKTGSGLLILGGENTFTGGLVIRNGTVEARTTNTALGVGAVVMGGIGSDGATLTTGRALGNAITINAPDSGSVVIGANGPGSGYMLSGGITLNGDLTLRTFDNTINGEIKAVSGITGGITGTGNVVLDNKGLAANVFNITNNPINHAGSLTLQGTATGNCNIGAVIGANVTGVLQNSATSTMVLSGANTYACNLTVNAGTVRISNNTNTANDASSVTIAATGATLDLTYTGTDKVHTLFIGSTQQADGVYGKLGSAPPVIGIPQITGDGTLTVDSVTPPGFSSWIASDFANGTVPIDQQGPNNDPDNDGISNLVEYAIAGHDPTVPNPSIGTLIGNIVSFSKRLDATGITYAIQQSIDLGAAFDWAEVENYLMNDDTTISYTLTPPTTPKNFIRLQVTQN